MGTSDRPIPGPQTSPEFLLSEGERRNLIAEAREMVERGTFDRERYGEIHTSLNRDELARDAAKFCAGYDANDHERLLRNLGTPEELEELAQHVSRAGEWLLGLRRSGVLEWSEECQLFLNGTAEEEIERLDGRLEQHYRLITAAQVEVEKAVLELKAEGWKFDPEQRCLVRTEQGHRPKRSLNAAIEALCEHWQIAENTVLSRKSIANAFHGFFPAELLDAWG